MKNDIQAKVQAETKKMSFQELRQYLTESLQKNEFWKRINRK
jgi:hypothetical protein